MFYNASFPARILIQPCINNHPSA